MKSHSSGKVGARNSTISYYSFSEKRETILFLGGSLRMTSHAEQKVSFRALGK